MGNVQRICHLRVAERAKKECIMPSDGTTYTNDGLSWENRVSASYTTQHTNIKNEQHVRLQREAKQHGPNKILNYFPFIVSRDGNEWSVLITHTPADSLLLLPFEMLDFILLSLFYSFVSFLQFSLYFERCLWQHHHGLTVIMPILWASNTADRNEEVSDRVRERDIDRDIDRDIHVHRTSHIAQTCREQRASISRSWHACEKWTTY